MTSEISTFGFIGDSARALPELALELADLGLLVPVEALGDRFAALSQRLAWDQEVTRATGRWNGDTPLLEDYVPADVIGQRTLYTSAFAGGLLGGPDGHPQPEAKSKPRSSSSAKYRCRSQTHCIRRSHTSFPHGLCWESWARSRRGPRC